MGNLAGVMLDLGDYGKADQLMKESLHSCQKQKSEWGLALALGTAAGVAAGVGQSERAIRLASASAAHRKRIGISLPPVFEERFERMIASARQALAESVQTRLWEEGQTMTLEQAIEYALNNSPISS
jgi:hypothetical protein